MLLYVVAVVDRFYFDHYLIHFQGVQQLYAVAAGVAVVAAAALKAYDLVIFHLTAVI